MVNGGGQGKITLSQGRLYCYCHVIVGVQCYVKVKVAVMNKITLALDWSE